MPEDSIVHIDFDELSAKAISQPLVDHIYTPTRLRMYLTERSTSIPRMILMQEFHSMIWGVSLPWKIIMFCLWIIRAVKQQIMEWRCM